MLKFYYLKTADIIERKFRVFDPWKTFASKAEATITEFQNNATETRDERVDK